MYILKNEQESLTLYLNDTGVVSNRESAKKFISQQEAYQWLMKTNHVYEHWLAIKY